MSDEVLSNLLDMGFSWADCQLAFSAGCVTIEQAVNHISQVSAFTPGQSSAGVLQLNKQPPGKTSQSDEQPNSTDPGNDAATSAHEQPVMHSRYSVTRDAQKLIAEKKAQQQREEIIRDKELKKLDHDSLVKEIQADKRARQELRNQGPSEQTSNIEPSEETKLENSEDNLRSRYTKKAKDDIEMNSKMHDMITEQKRKEREMKNNARLEALRKIEEDRQKRANAKCSSTETQIKSEESNEKSSIPVQANIQMTTGSFINIRFRLPNGESLVEKFAPGCLVSVLFDFVENQVKTKNYTLAEGFPPFTEIDTSKACETLRSLNMGNNIALVVKVAKPGDPIDVAPGDIVHAGPMITSQGQENNEENSELSSGEDISDVPYEQLHNIPTDEEQLENNEMELNEIEDAPGVGFEPPLDDENEDEAGLGLEPPLIAPGAGIGLLQPPRHAERNDDDEDEDEMRNFGMYRRGREAQYNITQRLGAHGTNESTNTTSATTSTATDVEMVLEETREMRRTRFLEAAQNRMSKPDPKIPEETPPILKLSCSTLRNIAADYVLKYFMQQKVNISTLDVNSAELLVGMLKQRGLLNGKTYRAFMTSGITSLDLAGYVFLTNDLVRTISLSNLTSLNLRGGENLTDAALIHIGQVSTLRTLTISHCPSLTSAAIGDLLVNLPNLEIFEAAATKLNSKTLEKLVNLSLVMKNLVVLDLSSTYVDDTAVFEVFCPILISLTVNDTKINSVTALANLKNLKSLSVSNCRLIDVTSLANCSKLEYLDISNSCDPEAMGEIFEALRGRLNLRKFNIPLRSNFTDSHLSSLAKMNITDVDLTNCCHLTAEGFRTYFKLLLSQGSFTIKSLILSNTNFDSSCVELVCGLSSLIELNLDYTKIKDQDVIAIRNLTQLTTLSLVGNNLSDCVFTLVLENDRKPFQTLTSLAKLNLSRNMALTNFGAKRLEHPNLETVSLMQTKVTSAIKDVMYCNMPQLKVLLIS